MKKFATFWSPSGDRTTKSAPTGLRSRQVGIERLEDRIAPAALAGLPGNANFEDPLDFAQWTVNSGPASAFIEYLSADASTTIVRDALAPEGDAYAHLSFVGRVSPTTTGFGPSLQSATFAATAGEEISVVWRATNNGDTAHPRGRLFSADGTPVATFFDSDTGTTPFTTSTVSVPASGEYYLLFEAGASDVSVGGLIGATLDIDAIHRTPSGITTSTLPNGQISVEVSGVPLSNDPNAFVVTLDQTGEYVQIFVNGSLDFVQPLITIDRISVLGLGGDDQLTVDSSNGLIAVADGIHFDGNGSLNSLALVRTGGSAQASEIYSIGLNPGEGVIQISEGGISQTVVFEDVLAVRDNVPAASFTVNGTSANDTITFAAGVGGGIFTGTTGKIAVDNSDSIEFNNKASLTINGMAGSDAINLNHPSAPLGLTSITVNGGDPSSAEGDRLHLQSAGSILPSAAGAGTIVAPGLPSIAFSGIEVATVAGFTVVPTVDGLEVTATGDRNFAGQDDAFIIDTDAISQFLTLTLNGSIALYADRAAIAGINAIGLAGNDSLTLTGTANGDTFNFSPATVDTGIVSIAGGITIDYASIDLIVLNGLGGDDTFAIGGAFGAVGVIGGSGSDLIDFSAAASRVVFNLDAFGADQFVNVTGQRVQLGDVIENFTGSAYNDTLRVKVASFPRNLNGGDNSQETYPPGDELILDGQQGVVINTLADLNTGVSRTAGYSDITFDEFEAPLIINSPSGPGFGVPGDSDAFNTVQLYEAKRGSGTSAVATADLNSDGFVDMVIAHSATSRISVMLNLGDGTFGSPVLYKSRGVQPRDIAIGNFDGNAGLDLAVTNFGSNRLSIFSGDNLGGFSEPTRIKTAANPLAIAVGRINGDAIDDLVITHTAGRKISVLLGTGSDLASPITFKTNGKRPVDVAIGDFNGDGKSDVVTANSLSNDVSFFQGDGVGGFALPTKFDAGKRPTALAVADYNLDGIVDVAVSNKVSRFVSVLFSDGAVAPETQFQPQRQIALPGNHKPQAIVAADFNGDGVADLGFGNTVGSNFTVLIGDFFGGFSQPYEFDLGKIRSVLKTGLAIADLNNDGLLDVITTSRGKTDLRVLLRKI